MMRYGGKKMRSVLWDMWSDENGSSDGCYAKVKDGSFVIMWNEEFEAKNQTLNCEEIMGSWVEVKE